MAIFISYSHADKDFVDKLAISLAGKRIPVFVDRWEMKVGESITNKIQKAITEASFLIVVLSKNSIKSDWCNREITSGLLLELELKRVVILPVLLEDCEIPLFLRDKYFADFRTNFNSGLNSILESVASLGSENNGRISENENLFTDYTTSCGLRGEYFEFQIDVVEFSTFQTDQHTILTSVIFVGNKVATDRFKLQLQAGNAWLMPYTILMLCSEDKRLSGFNAHLIHDQHFQTTFELGDTKNNISFRAYVTIKRLGLTDGKDKLYYFGNIFDKLWKDAKEKEGKLK